MSVPVNPLDRFRSYAYHHILVAAGSTEAIRAFTTGEGEVLKNLKLGQTAGGQGSEYYLVFDTRKNSFFSITDVSYTSSAFANTSRMSNTIYSTVDMQIVDSTGMTLVNYLKWLQDNGLKTSLYKMVFMLKTIFVGHTYDGKTETVYQDAIPMVLKNMVLNPSHQGSQISASFCPITNGAVYFMEDYSRTFDIPSVFSSTGKLSDALKNLQLVLNYNSRQWFQKLQLEITKNDETKKEQPSLGYGKLVQYMITIPDDWESFSVLGIFDRMTETVFKKIGIKNPVTPSGVKIGFTVNPKTEILDLIEQILKQSTDVQKLASNENVKKGFIRTYKIIPTVTSDETTVVIHFDIVNFTIPKIEDDSNKTEGKDQVGKTSAFVKPKSDSDSNVFTFDYLFTGKNADILNFDLKMNNINLAIADDLIIGDKSSQESAKDQKDKETDEAKTVKKTVLLNVKEKDPILPPFKTLSQAQNVSWSTETDSRSDVVKSRQQFIQNMSKIYAACSQDLILKIRGNPDLYKRFTDSTLMPHVKSIDFNSFSDGKYVTSEAFLSTVEKGSAFAQSEEVMYKEALKKRTAEMGVAELQQSEKISSLLPLYVKVNIKLQNVDLIADHFDTSFKPYDKFWYDGYYIVRKIVHHFSKGEFHQELLIGAVVDDLFGQEQSDKNKVDTATDKSDKEVPNNISPMGMP